MEESGPELLSEGRLTIEQNNTKMKDIILSAL